LSPILVRPVREQLEHDRVIRLLQAKYKRKFDVAINPGNEQSAPVGNGTSPWYPDLVLQERGRKLVGVVEVETAESVNNLEAMSQWVAFGKLRAQFHLYVPASAIDSTRRLCADLGIPVAEIWAYHSIGDQLRFTLVQKTAVATPKAEAEPRPASAPKAAPKAPLNGAGRSLVEKPVTKVAAARPAPNKTDSSTVEKVAAAKPAPKQLAPKPAPKSAAPSAASGKTAPKVVPAAAKKAAKKVTASVPAAKAAPVKAAPARIAPAKQAATAKPAKKAAVPIKSARRR
jgi:hypothetical protein